MNELNDIISERMSEAVSEALRDLDADDYGLVDAEDVRDKLYDLTALIESAAGSANYLLHADVGELRDRVHELESELDQIAQSVRDWHSEL